MTIGNYSGLFSFAPPAAASKKRKRSISGTPRTPAKGGCPLQSRSTIVNLTPMGCTLAVALRAGNIPPLAGTLSLPYTMRDKQLLSTIRKILSNSIETVFSYDPENQQTERRTTGSTG